MTMLFYVLVLCLASWSVDARSDYVGYIRPHTYTSWGYWGHPNWCAAGSYAYGFRLKVETQQGIGDDTALNAIQLLCRTYCGAHSHSITSRIGDWGSWTNTKTCVAHYLMNGAQARSAPGQGHGDDTAANNYNFLCQNTRNTAHHHLLHGNGMYWGYWTSRKHCPIGSYICGIITQVEPWQKKGDDTALNGAIFLCCRLTRTGCSGKRSFTK